MLGHIDALQARRQSLHTIGFLRRACFHRLGSGRALPCVRNSRTHRCRQGKGASKRRAALQESGEGLHGDFIDGCSLVECSIAKLLRSEADGQCVGAAVGAGGAEGSAAVADEVASTATVVAVSGAVALDAAASVAEVAADASVAGAVSVPAAVVASGGGGFGVQGD